MARQARRGTDGGSADRFKFSAVWCAAGIGPPQAARDLGRNNSYKITLARPSAPRISPILKVNGRWLWGGIAGVAEVR